MGWVAVSIPFDDDCVVVVVAAAAVMRHVDDVFAIAIGPVAADFLYDFEKTAIKIDLDADAGDS